MVTDAARRNLYTAIADLLGAEPADTLMELLPPVGWGDVARQGDLVAVRGEMAELRGEIAGVRAELKGEMAELRGGLTVLAARIDALPARMLRANIATNATLVGLVLAGAKLA